VSLLGAKQGEAQEPDGRLGDFHQSGTQFYSVKRYESGVTVGRRENNVSRVFFSNTVGSSSIIFRIQFVCALQHTTSRHELRGSGRGITVVPEDTTKFRVPEVQPHVVCA